MKALEQELASRFGARLAANRPLAEFTSFRIGGPADLMMTVNNETELAELLAICWRYGAPAFCLGSGTNLLVSDRGVRGVVVRLGEAFRRIEIDGLYVRAGSAAAFGVLVRMAVDCGLAGLEYGEGIPGSVGGALVMNAGAFGGEMARTVMTAEGMTLQGEKLSLLKNEINFAYRRGDLPSGFIITAVNFALARGDRAQLHARIAELSAKRAAHQPRGVPNAGSIFKNPPGNFAGRLLENAGLKGTRVRGAAFSNEHANFILNVDDARANDVRDLIEMARKRVRESTGIALEPEVRLVGDW
ncbi:MAG: UDP-N-acetylmuramate dehydrogenase [Candidatus Binataceae bacterium]